ncbi:hypothetical protein MN0502_10290 [Arthrobacter sp. MN05-02]|nr:hypothetical protein MN0502_10290 [Arthrobacter sp. MN05-02]
MADEEALPPAAPATTGPVPDGCCADGTTHADTSTIEPRATARYLSRRPRSGPFCSIINSLLASDVTAWNGPEPM